MFRTSSSWIKEYERRDAFWMHSGNPKDPHALLTSGMHSDGFFNSRPVIADENLLRDAAHDLLELFQEQGDIAGIDCVVGPQTGATGLARLMSKHIRRLNRRQCSWASPAKQEVDGRKAMVFDFYCRDMVSRSNVLLCEDVLTTGGSIELTKEAVETIGGHVAGTVLVLVNRSGYRFLHGCRIISLVNAPMSIWEPEGCLLCKEGSVAVRPKDNWAALTCSSG